MVIVQILVQCSPAGAPHWDDLIVAIGCTELIEMILQTGIKSVLVGNLNSLDKGVTDD